MAQAIYLERGAHPGPVDFTKFVYSIGSISMRKNEPTLFDFSVAHVSDVTGWFAPGRGDYVQVWDDRFENRNGPTSAGLLFTGYVTNDPEYEFLGTANHTQVFGYKLSATSEDYLINSKRVPNRTFINKTRGYILRELLNDMFGGSSPIPFDLTNILDGGTERIFQTDPARYWTEVAADFGRSDGYVYYVLDRKVYYVPEMKTPAQGSVTSTITISAEDPRFSPDNLSIKRRDESIVNDLTIIGDQEATTTCVEQFVSDGYQPAFDLTYIPYGLEQSSILVDDMTNNDIDDTVWEELDQPANYIQPFNGSLNIVGGPGNDTGLAYLRSRKGIELSGTIALRDGEIFFPPSPTGTGFIGGLYTSEDCRQSHLWSGWFINLTSLIIQPWGPSGGHGTFGINPNWHYVLRRTVTVDRFADLSFKVFDADTGYQYSTSTAPLSAKVSYSVEVIDYTTDPSNVTKTTHDLGTFTYTSPDYVLYAAIVPYSCHLAMNYVSVTKPQQFAVELGTATQDASNVWTLNKSAIKVGNAIDGGRCTIEVDGDRSKLAWYATNLTSRALGASPSDATTIPPRGTIVSVRYARSDYSRARLQSSVSIASEKARFKDDGIRQMTLTGDDIKPLPRTSEECLFLARALLADRNKTRYEGSYSFITKADDETELRLMILPGDKLECTIDTPEGQINEILDVTNVTISLVGEDTYQISLDFGPVNRFDQAQRELLRRRNSSLEEVVIQQTTIYTAEAMNANGYVPVPDLPPPTVNTVGPDYITVTFGSSLPAGVDGVEIRLSDSGWGQPGYVVRMTDSSRGLNRLSREVRYFFRAYRINADSSLTFSQRSSMMRHVYPLRNKIQITGITGNWSATGNVFKFFIPMPSDPDWAKISVRSGGTLIYEGDGVDHSVRLDYVTAMISSGRIELDIEDLLGQPSYTIGVLPYNVLGLDADNTFQVNYTVSK